MSKPGPAPADQLQRTEAVDPACSVLVQAPAGSGKTTLLAERFLALLAEVDAPGQVVAITFTNAAAAEMRNRILDKLRDPEPGPAAQLVLDRSAVLGWKLLDLPAQLRISTIDSFCRELALQQPLLAGLGGGLAIAEQPGELYRRAARSTLNQLSGSNSALIEAIEKLLMWRDNNWREVEDLLVTMLSNRDRWMQDFVLSQRPDWEQLRARLERPFAHAVRAGLEHVSRLLDGIAGARDEVLQLARFACTQEHGEQHQVLAELVEVPNAPFVTHEELEAAHQALICVSDFLMTNESKLRRAVDKRNGFPANRKAEKERIVGLNAQLREIAGMEEALAAVRELPPARYPEEDWTIVRACFTLLRHAAAHLKVVFADAAAVDFIEVAQIASNVLKAEDGSPTEAAMAVADGIRHLLVDEFQDTSRRQHRLLANLIAAWPDRAGRTLFAVGDPMQSIYFFRDADAELFSRVKEIGLESADGDSLELDFKPLTANFRTTPVLVDKLNEAFAKVFAEDDGSSVGFSPAIPARDPDPASLVDLKFHIDFCLQSAGNRSAVEDNTLTSSGAEDRQINEIVALIRDQLPYVESARSSQCKYRVAVLARTRSTLVRIAKALHLAAIPFRALDLEQLDARPEVLDALALGRALLNPQDRLAWLSVLRAPWCGLTVAELHALTSADDPALLARPVPDLLLERQGQLDADARAAVSRVLAALEDAAARRANLITGSLGTWLQQVWLSLGGSDCWDRTARANLDLLWSCLDRLPEGEQDLLGPALAVALAKLTALPDPASSSDCGVQLMTIHKSKGLEFEVVIVPDLQAKASLGRPKLLSWLERGVRPEDAPARDDSEATGEITEFLIAPLQTKGEYRGKSKAWVDRIYRQRETQEMRRILYVATTRARDELHLFARPAVKVQADGDLTLQNPSGSLLATAWPAFEEEIRARFEAWKAAQKSASSGVIDEPDSIAGNVQSLAASSAEAGLFVVSSAAAPAPEAATIRRLPSGYSAQKAANAALSAPNADGPFARPIPAASQPAQAPLYTRHEGGLHSRALGTAVHSLLEELARLRTTLDWPAARAAIEQRKARIAAQVRSLGAAPAEAAQLASAAMETALNAADDPLGRWLLSPAADAASEVRWTGVVDGALRTVQVDRVFRAGLNPQAPGDAAWWIVDYKTHVAPQDQAADLAALRPLFAAQLAAYAGVLRGLHGADVVVRAGLYYPRMAAFDWWEI